MMLICTLHMYLLQVVAELAEELWDLYGFDIITDYCGIFDALSHKNYNVRAASAEALAAALDENPDKMQVSIQWCKFPVLHLYSLHNYIE